MITHISQSATEIQTKMQIHSQFSRGPELRALKINMIERHTSFEWKRRYGSVPFKNVNNYVPISFLSKQQNGDELQLLDLLEACA
jgi:hypothetical protein